MLRLSVVLLVHAMLTSINIAAQASAIAGTRYAQYYPPPHYGYPPPNYRPPCYAVTPEPFQGAARGAAGGALLGRSGAMPGAAQRSAPASALSAAQYVGVRLATRAPATKADDLCRGPKSRSKSPPPEKGAMMKKEIAVRRFAWSLS